MMLLVSGFTLQANPVHLRCESLVDPLGIDIEKPLLSWQSDSTERNWRQSAYQILVASRTDLLSSGKADIWDSGRQTAPESPPAFSTVARRSNRGNDITGPCGCGMRSGHVFRSGRACLVGDGFTPASRTGVASGFAGKTRMNRQTSPAFGGFGCKDKIS